MAGAHGLCRAASCQTPVALPKVIHRLAKAAKKHTATRQQSNIDHRQPAKVPEFRLSITAQAGRHQRGLKPTPIATKKVSNSNN